jgi:hypothetical protein
MKTDRNNQYRRLTMKQGSSKLANNSADAAIYQGIDVPPEPLNDVVSSVQGGSVLEMHTGLYSHGRNRALHSGVVEPQPGDVAALTDHARAMARQTYRDKYDPSQNVHDAMHDAEYRRLFGQRTEAEMGEQHGAANLRDAEDKLAYTPEAGPKPHAHPLLIAAFTVGITLTVAPTLHDLLTITDDMLAWFAAILSSAFVGFMLTFAILSGRRSTWTWIGVTAGVILGLGLGAVRLSATSDATGMGIGVGLTIMEIAMVLLLEWCASGLRRKDEEWLPKHGAEMQAVAARDAAQANLSRCKETVKELDEAIAAKIALVENRHNRNIHLPELEAVAIKAVMDGYNAGIAENKGRLRGVRYPVWRTA